MDFPAKILLFGEYGILLGSKALAIPYSRCSGRFDFVDAPPDSLSERGKESNNELKRLHNFFISNSSAFRHLDLERLEEEINCGIFFDSSIPAGFGLGSSGALTAALYDRYKIGYLTNEYQEIKAHLAAIETCFHGISSGIDPLTSFLKKPVLLDNSNAQVTAIDLSPFLNTYTLFLLNSQARGNTGNLVRHFMEQYRYPEFKEKIDNEYIPVINQTIDAVSAGDFGSFETLIARYSLFQFTNFQKMVPKAMKKHFEHGTSTGDFNLKLCGSGGGGYMLAISRNRLKAENYFKLNHFDYNIV